MKSVQELALFFIFSRTVCNNVFVHSSDFAALLSRGVNCARECGCDWC